jgi:hypothetical protein
MKKDVATHKTSWERNGDLNVVTVAELKEVAEVAETEVTEKEVMETNILKSVKTVSMLESAMAETWVSRCKWAEMATLVEPRWVIWRWKWRWREMI